jgi:hypothetical protein
MSARLVRIEIRRSTALWLTPVMATLAWVIFQQQYTGALGVAWSDRSMAIRDIAQPVWPLVAGAAAWMAGRRRRRGMAELLSTTPYPAWWRELRTWAGTVAWGILVYLLVALVIMAVTWAQATWGGPSLGPIMVGLLALIASGSLGYAVGYFLPSRFTPPLVSVVLFETIQLIYNNHTWYSFLVPPAHGQLTVWGITPDLSGPQSLFLLGLTGVALGSLGVAVHRALVPLTVLLAGLLLATAGVMLIQRNVPSDSFGQPMALSEFPLSHITPACSHDSISVCVHPAFRARLPVLTRTINRIAAPLAGLPGTPDRFIDDDIVAGMGGPILGSPSSAAQEAQVRRDGLYVFSTPPAYTAVFDPDDSPAQIALALVFLNSVKGPPTDAQEAIMMWLLRRAGFSPDLSPVNRMFFGLAYSTAPRVAARRFATLSTSQQRAWLRTHFSAVQTGKLGLADLP